MIDAVSIKEGEGIPEPGKPFKSAETGDRNFPSESQGSSTERVAEATRAVKETMGEVCCESWEGIKKAFNYTRHQPVTLVMLGIGAGLIVGCWILYRRKN